MRKIKSKIITQAVKEMCISSNINLPKTLEEKIIVSKEKESNSLAKSIFCDLIENIEVAKTKKIPICQDTGMVVVFAEIGNEVKIIGDDFETAVNKGVEQGYVEGLLRLSVVSDPLNRVNTNTNTPAIIHINIVKGDKIKLVVAPKGMGSENMSAVKMMTPSATPDDIVNFVTGVVKTAGSNPCPPIIVGVGIGGNFEYSTYLAKKALCRDISKRNENPFYAELEEKMLKEINKLNIGSQGFGGDITALAVNIEQFATHIAGLPVAVNIGCHVTRHEEIIL